MKENPVIHTKQLLLRPVCLDDIEVIYRYRSDGLTNQFQGWLPKSLEEVRDFIDNKTAPVINIEDTWFQFVIVRKEKVIGDVGVHFLGPDNMQAELGCTLAKDMHGRGYATEALQGVIDFLFHKLNKHRIIASIDPGNVKSIQLVVRLGFRKEAHFRKSLLVDGKWIDDLVFALLQEDWYDMKK